MLSTQSSRESLPLVNPFSGLMGLILQSLKSSLVAKWVSVKAYWNDSRVVKGKGALVACTQDSNYR